MLKYQGDIFYWGLRICRWDAVKVTYIFYHKMYPESHGKDSFVYWFTISYASDVIPWKNMSQLAWLSQYLKHCC